MEELNKVEGEHFDLIIANPPYGKIGANITKKIIDTIDFDEYVNLLPANDYKRNDTRDLYKYVDIDSMKPVSRGFKDAAVTTHMARIMKKPHTYISWDEFQIENYTDDSLKKYFYENLKRSHYAIDVDDTWVIFSDTINNTTSVLFDHRCCCNHHLAYSKNTDEYKWNVEKSIDLLDLANEFKGYTKANKYHVDFASEIEKNNFVKFMYSANGFRFFSKIFTAVNVDSTKPLSKLLPKVDWTREWTVEEILADYGYTAKEIKEVMDDLVNFKGMEE